MIVDFNRGDELVCLSMPSLMEHLEEFFILLLEDLILHYYLVVLSFQLIDFSLKSKLLSFFPLLPHNMHKGSVILCVVASFAPHVGEGCLVK
ncbi:hypothetical protein ACFX1T_009694 [Malus domestica]